MRYSYFIGSDVVEELDDEIEDDDEEDDDDDENDDVFDEPLDEDVSDETVVKTTGEEKIIHKYKIKPGLFSIEGKQQNELEIVIDVDYIRELIRGRIEKGVSNFFECLSKNASRYVNEENDNDLHINIFLAGNSCRSTIVTSLFDEYIKRENEKIVSNSRENYFNLFYPLGTEKANEQIRQRNIIKNGVEIPPDCKTGVAYGLLLTRKGGKIKVIDKRTVKTIFDYYIGISRKNKFIHKTDKNISFEKWYELIDASEDTFELYYTSYPEAINDCVPISETKKIVCNIKTTNEDAFIYYRPVSSNEIEYVVASVCNNGVINENDMLTEPERVMLK